MEHDKTYTLLVMSCQAWSSCCYCLIDRAIVICISSSGYSPSLRLRKREADSGAENEFVAELRRAKRASGALWLRFSWKSIHVRNFGYDVSLRLYSRPRVQTVGVEVGRQDSLQGWECWGIFPWREITWQRCICQPAFFWREIISDEQRDKEQERA